MFPFRQIQQHGDHLAAHGNDGRHTELHNNEYDNPRQNNYHSGEAKPVLPVPTRGPRQGGADGGFGDDITLDLGAVAAAGERCIDKVVMVEETRYDDVIHCQHSYSEECHTTYITDFQPQQEEECNACKL